MALHLTEASYACPVLTNNKSARQKVLEDSIYKVTMDCWKHKVKKFEKLGLGSSRPRYMYLQACMYKFMEKLDKLLAEEIAKLQAAKQVDNRELHTTALLCETPDR